MIYNQSLALGYLAGWSIVLIIIFSFTNYEIQTEFLHGDPEPGRRALALTQDAEPGGGTRTRARKRSPDAEPGHGI